MALLTCPDCQREVSDKAVACPQCGHPFRAVPGQTARRPMHTKAASAAAKAVAFLMIVAGMLMAMAGVASTVGVVMMVAGFVGFIAARFSD